MSPILQRAVAVAFVVAACFETHAAEHRLVIAGTLFEDRLSLAVRPHFVPLEGASLKVYRDGGDRVPSSDDVLSGSTKTNEAGVYLLHVEQKGDYWLTVDSRSIGAGRAWAEQTFGPSGSICGQPDGTTRTLGFEGSCFGGRSSSRSDDATTLTTSEHVALVTVDEPVTGGDFAFSFDVVITTADGQGIQGSFRQFLLNAAAVPGPNRMRFVPVVTAPEQRQTTFGVPPRWWKITMGAPLPEVSDADTLIDGSAYNFISAGSQIDVHPGRLGEAPTFKLNERRNTRLQKPELELVLQGETGVVCSARCGIRAVALYGTPVGVVARADVSLEHMMIGAAPDGIPPDMDGTTGLRIESATTVAREVMVTAQSSIGIEVAKGARLDADRLDISRCGAPQSGGAIVLFSNGSSIRTSTIAGNAGAGVILGAIDGSAPANGNAIDSSTISANQAGILFSPRSSRNTITRNDIIWNRFGGVTVAPHAADAAPIGNRLSANRFDENGLRPIVLNLETANPNQLSSASDKCERSASLANEGIATPRVTNVTVMDEQELPRVTVRGRACPGEIVEVYQSFVTSGIRDESPDVPDVRKIDRKNVRETITSQERTRALPSIGEFNYLGATTTASDGTFEATFSIVVTMTMESDPEADQETDVWAREVLRPSHARDRAFSAIAIDPAGNTSEMSVRRGVD